LVIKREHSQTPPPQKKGLFKEADGGTLFLDEISSLPLTLQAKLLRVLEEKAIRPLGDSKEIPVDVRVVAATNSCLENEISNGSFREDLYYRLNVIQLDIPPLRERGMDVLRIAQHFVSHFAKKCGRAIDSLSKQTASKLMGYRWPGNVRELRNVIERAVILTKNTELTVEDLPQKIRNYETIEILAKEAGPEELVSMDEVERRYIIHVLKHTNHNRSIAAKILGFDRKTLYRKIQKFGLESPEKED
jgi:two-component system response regulator HydG